MHTPKHPSAPAVPSRLLGSSLLSSQLRKVRISWTWPQKLLLLIGPAIAAMSFFAFGTVSPPSIPAISLSSDPLFTAATADKPVMTLALSVEFPTVGAQYRGSNDYSNANEYLGYYDAESCYTYINTPTETPATGQTSADYKRFQRVGAATSRMCNTAYPEAFSGNFLNWATNSAIDMMRLALTGGDRSIDTPTLTLLQRAYLPNGDYENGCFFNNGSYFPAKQLPKTVSGKPNYYGAVPATMQTLAGSNDIWIANTLNRIYFRAGAGSTGSCTDTSGYTLGGPAASSSSWMGSITSYDSKPSGWPATPAYDKGDTIILSGVQEVLYGFNKKWASAPASGSITCDDSIFTTGHQSNKSQCFVRNNTTSENPPASTSLTSDTFFYARVKVCDVDSAGTLLDVRDYGLCSKYSDGNTPAKPNYKPTGTIQKYSDQLRLAAFGYLMDQASASTTGWGSHSARYGGVLRAPMKYVGAKTFDESGIDNTPTGGNTKAEWNSVTGVFNADPDGPTTTFAQSGVINYLNKFGRTGGLGRYKGYDPVGELYGEALRYLQGLGPTAEAFSSLTSAMYDGFPVTTNWTDPYGGTRSSSADYSCLKSNILVVGDVNSWDSNRLLTRTASASNNLPDFGAWNTIVKKFEAKTSGTYVDGQGVSQNISNPNTANTNSQVGANGQQGPLVGAAYWAHTHDIRGTSWTTQPTLQRPGLRVKSFFFDVNENSSSNTTSYRRNQNQYFTAAKYGGFETDPSNTSKNPYNTKGNPFYQDDLTTANKYVWEDTDTRTSRVGEANTYYLQSDARGVLSAFNDIFARASTAARSIAGGAIQSKNLTQAGDTIYQGTFDTSDWSGDLLAIPVNVSSSNVVSIGTTNTWTAATQLAVLTAPATSRKIYVGNSGATQNPVAVAFTWATIEQSLMDSLNKLSPTASADGLGQDRLNFLRGDKSKEGSQFRTRSKLLGDIINSGVVYSGAPTKTINDADYSTFYASNKDRTAAVFVGANDGMLHAFNGGTGDELFAYIPSWLGSKLSALTSTTYANNHQSYVDGTPAVAEAQVGSAWKTVLVSGTGAGGKGVFALDVTTPASFTASNVLWEFTNADDADLGNITGRPQILKLRTSAYGATPTYKWFAVFGSGVNNYVDSGGIFSATGNPALFILDLNKTAGSAWALGTNYYKITLPVSIANKATGLINFRAALGAAKEVTQIFMGDLHGNLWKLDFSLLGVSDWNMGKLSYFLQGTSNNPIPMFIAKDTAGGVQPITAAPTIVYGPVVDSAYILFGTGKYLESSDKSNTATQSAYMVYDNAKKTLDSSPASTATSAISSRLRLKSGSVDTSNGVVTVPAFTVGRATTNTDTTNPRSGWVFDFPFSKERQISSSTVFGSKIIVGSLIPGGSSGSSCSASGGGGNQYTIDILSGNGTSVGSSVGIQGEPLVAEITGLTTYSSACGSVRCGDGRRIKTITSQVLQQGSDGIAVGTTQTKTLSVGRLTWRQINNYQDLKNQ